MTHKEAKKILLQNPEVAAEYALAAYRQELKAKIKTLKKGEERQEGQVYYSTRDALEREATWNSALEIVLRLLDEEEYETT